MFDLLSKYPLHFPSRNDESYTLKQFLIDVVGQCDRKYRFPIIVHITSLNTYGRSIKGLLNKNSSLLLIDIDQLNSILAEYHGTPDNRHHNVHRYRLNRSQSRTTSKFLNMKKLSKSVASLTSTVPINPPVEEHDRLTNTNENMASTQRYLANNLSEKRSSSFPLCRVPIHYNGYFEVLDENDKSVEPCHRIGDLIITEYENNDSSSKRIERWPQTFLLRTSCTAYREKFSPDGTLQTLAIRGETTADEEFSSKSFDSTSDNDILKTIVVLNEEPQTLVAGEILMIQSSCCAYRPRLSDKESRETTMSSASPSSPSPSPTSASWIRGKSILSFLRKRRTSQSVESPITEINSQKFKGNQTETYLKCQTQRGETVYISMHETGLFSPLKNPRQRLKTDRKDEEVDITGVFQLEDLLSNFRFPISVRLLNTSIHFENIYAPAVVNPSYSTLTKFRLLMPYNERVVFACPLHLLSSKSQKMFSSLVVIPISINADILIQPCLNMSDYVTKDAFIQLVQNCIQTIKLYRSELSLIHFPLQLTNDTLRSKPILREKRSQSESNLEYLARQSYRYSDEHLNVNENDWNVPWSAFSMADQPATNDERDDRQNFSDSEDKMYQDVDKIYDYVRSGDITDEVKKIQAKELASNKNNSFDLVRESSPTNRKYERQLAAVGQSPGQMKTHRFPPNLVIGSFEDDNNDFHSCKNDGYVDENEAHHLFLASKQRISNLRPTDPSENKPITKMKRISKH